MTAGRSSVERGRDRLERDLDASLDTITHRGPDSRGRWFSEDNRVGSQTRSRCDVLQLLTSSSSRSRTPVDQ